MLFQALDLSAPVTSKTLLPKEAANAPNSPNLPAPNTICAAVANVKSISPPINKIKSLLLKKVYYNSIQPCRRKSETHAITVIFVAADVSQRNEIYPYSGQKYHAMNAPSLENIIIHIDDHLIVVNKPAGLRVIPDGYNPSLPNLRDMLNTAYPKTWVVHRLDKDTSGILLFARDADTHRALNQQFEKRAIQKEYLLITIGTPDWQTRTVKLPLRTNGDRKHRTVVDFVKGKAAETEFTIKEKFKEYTLLTASPHSGYTHQIRAHISAAGFPILGDTLYWQAESHIPKLKQQPPSSPPLSFINRVALHAARIEFYNAVTNDFHVFTASPPADFLSSLAKIRSL